MLILAFESSCDESSVALLRDQVPIRTATLTQSVHQKYGGVVPELSSRTHLALLDKLCTEVFFQTGETLKDVALVAATVGPGLIGSLLVGVGYARGVSCSLGIPFRGVHHVEAHLWSAEIEHGELPLPALVLLVSGGHSLLILVRGLRRYEVLGSTLDDAMGEAFDKVGKILGLGFPAGAEVERKAAQGDPDRFSFPIFLQDSSCDFSFSGLKTAVLYAVRDLGEENLQSVRDDVLASFQRAAIRSVLLKVKRAVEGSFPRALVVAGGVAANSALRTGLKGIADDVGIPFFAPSLALCTDNATMVGYLAWKMTVAKLPSGLEDAPRPRWPIDALLATE